MLLGRRRAQGVVAGAVRVGAARRFVSQPSWLRPKVAPLQSKPSHHQPDGTYENPWPSSRKVRVRNAFQLLGQVQWENMNTKLSAPTEALDLELLRAPRTDLQVTWIGHATFLVQIGGVNILTDPVFSEWVFPVQRMGPPRVTPVPCRPAELPPIDLVLVSHSHYDHLDIPSIGELQHASKTHLQAGASVRGVRHGKATERRFGGTRYVAPRDALRPAVEGQALFGEDVALDCFDWWEGLDVALRSDGSVGLSDAPMLTVPDARPSGELVDDRPADAWGDNEAAWRAGRPDDATVRVVTTPAQHNTQRWHNDRNASLWGGFAVESGGRRFYFTGDTGLTTVQPGEEVTGEARDDPTVPLETPFCPVFRQLGAALGPFDACALPIGAYSPRWFMSSIHTDPCDAARMHVDLRSRRSVGMHWGTFQLTSEPLLEPMERTERCAAAIGQEGLFTAEPVGRTLQLGEGTLETRVAE